MARYYHEPEPFRYDLGAFIQAARNVTFMLQKEQAAFKDFKWYQEWAERAKKDSVLRWLGDARTDLVHRQALEPHSWLEVRCVGNPRQTEDSDNDHFGGKVSPFECTHYYMNRGPSTDHGHEFTRFWGIEALPGRELLEVCADVYDRLDELVRDAHQRLGAGMVSHQREGSNRTLPCMEDITKHRVAHTVVRDGREVWEGEPPRLHHD